MFSLTLQERNWVTDMNFKKDLRSYRGMTARNIKVYAKDKMAILLSMLTQIIVLGLFLIFLKNNYIDAINSNLGGLQNLIDSNDIQALVNSWLVAGVIGTSVVTVALNSLSVMVSDKQERIDYDYNATAVKGSTVVLSYFTGAVINTFITTSILLSAGLIFLSASGAFSYTAIEILKIYGLVLLGSISASTVLMAFVSFFKKSSTLSSFGIMISAAIGFVVGAYVPVSQFGESVQTAVNLVPGSQIAGMMRNVLMQPAIDNIDKALGGIDNGKFAKSAADLFALKLNILGNSADMNFMMIYTLAAIAVFLVLNIILFKFSSKHKN